MKFAFAGTLVGLLLALVVVIGGLTGFLVAVVFGAVGAVVGAHYDGTIDLRAVARGRGRG